MHIPKGTVVTVITDHTQGVVQADVTDPEQEVPILYGREYSYLFGFDFDPVTAVRTARGADLEPQTDFTPENRADRLFPRHWHHFAVFDDPWDPAQNRDCQHLPCGAKATKRVMVNVWGTVCELEMCDSCATQWHGKRVEDVPAKRSPGRQHMIVSGGLRRLLS